jgi:hypothetical protein
MTTQTATQQETSTSSQQTAQSTSQVNSDVTITSLAQGLMKLIGPVVRECDERIQSVYKSQEELSNQIDSLSKGFFYFKKSQKMKHSSTPIKSCLTSFIVDIQLFN